MTRIAVVGRFSSEAGVINSKRRYFERLTAELDQLGYGVDLYDQSTIENSMILPERSRHIQLVWKLEQSIGRVDPTLLLNAKIPSLLYLDKYIQSVRETKGPQHKRLLKIASGITRINRILFRPSISAVLFWCTESPLGELVQALGKINGVPVIGVEGGIFPGSVEFDTFGHQERCLPVRKQIDFSRLPVSDEELSNTKGYLKACSDNKVSKKIQPTSDTITDAQIDSEKFVLHLGVDPAASGLKPRFRKKSKSFSPYFDSEEDVLKHLSSAAKDHGLKVIYKPHPNVSSEHLPDIPNVMTIQSANVFDLMENAEIISTLGTTLSGSAIELGKPCLLLGRNVLCSVGCCYELAESKSELPKLLKNAIENGLTAPMVEAWHQYAARLMKYYAFSYSVDLEETFGRGPSAAAEYIQKLIVSQLPIESEKIVQRVTHEIVSSFEGETHWIRQYVNLNKSRILSDFNLVTTFAQAGSKILDIGGTPPLLSMLLATQNKCNVHLADPSASYFSSHLTSHQIEFSDVNVTNDKLPFPSNSFEFVTLCEVIEHIPGDLRPLFSEVSRVLKPDGHLLVTTPNLRSISGLVALLGYQSGLASKPKESLLDQFARTDAEHGYFGHLREFTASEVIGLVESQGFTHVSSNFQPNYLSHLPAAGIVRKLESYFPSWALFGKYVFRKR